MCDWFDFGEDPDPDPTTRIFKVILHHWEIGAKNDIVLYSMIFQKRIGPDMFSWIRHYVVEVCALPSAVLVYWCNFINNSSGFFATLDDRLVRQMVSPTVAIIVACSVNDGIFVLGSITHEVRLGSMSAGLVQNVIPFWKFWKKTLNLVLFLQSMCFIL